MNNPQYRMLSIKKISITISRDLIKKTSGRSFLHSFVLILRRHLLFFNF